MKSPLLHAALLVGGITYATPKVLPPNVLIVYTDEHNFRTLQTYLPLISENQRFPWGKNVPLETPNINFLAEHGVIMNNCYVSTPLSTPSRSSLMTGLYPQKTGCTNNNMVMDTSIKTIAQLFLENGYRTGYAGKWHLSGDAKPGWDPAPDYGWHDNAYMLNRGHYKSVKDAPSGGSPLLPSSESALLDGYDVMTEFLTNKTVKFIQENKLENFLFVLSIPDPHGPNVASHEYFEMFKSFVFSKPPTASKNMDDYPGWAKGNAVLTQKDYQNYWGMVKCIDDNVGRVIDALRDNDLIDKTIIVFTSDHGDMCGEHGRVDKSVPLEGSMKVPFIVYAPSIIGENCVVNEAVSNIDLFPTLAELCLLKGMPVTDGISIVPLLKGTQGYTGRNIVFSRSSGDASGWISATTDRYKFVVSSSTNDSPWLIDKQTDPDELINFYNNPEYAAVRDTLKEKLIQYCEQNNEPKFKNSKIRADLGIPPLITDSSTTNLLRNGYFDLDGTSWSLSNTDILFESDPETEINGITCRLPGVNNSRSIKQIIDIVPEISYLFSFKGRIQNAFGASESQINNHETSGIATLKGEVLLPNKTVLLTLSTQEPATQSLSGIFTVPADVSSVSVSLSKNWNIAYLDEVIITDLTNTGNITPIDLSCMQLLRIDRGFSIKSINPIQTASVFDIAGRRIKYLFKPGFSADVSPLENGIYLTHVTFSEGKSISRKYQVID